MFIQGQQGAEVVGAQALHPDEGGRAATGAGAVMRGAGGGFGRHALGHEFGLPARGVFAVPQRVGLAQRVGQQRHVFAQVAVPGMGYGDDFVEHGNGGLVQQLKIGVLHRGAHAADDRRAADVDGLHAVGAGGFAQRFHQQLLQVQRHARERIAIQPDGEQGQAKAHAIGVRQASHQPRGAAFQRGAEEVLVHIVRAGVKLGHGFTAEGEQQHHAVGTPQREASADLGQRAEDLIRRQAKALQRQLSVGSERDQALAGLVSADAVAQPAQGDVGVAHDFLGAE